MSDDAGGFLIVAIIALSIAIGWYLVFVAKVEWFRSHFLSGVRHRQILSMLPIVVPLALLAWLVVVPALS